METGWIFLIVLVAIGGFLLSYHFKQKRRQEMAAFAKQNGLQYSTEDPFNLLGWPFSLFGKGDGRGVENVVWGAWKSGGDVTACDYWYYEESTDSQGQSSRSYKRFHCALVEVPATFPHLEVAREGFLSWLADHTGFEDIEFESPEFNRRYNVKASEKKFAYELLDARMLEWLVESDRGYAFEVLGNRLLAYSKRGSPSELLSLIGTTLIFRDRIPRVAWGLYPKSG
jgi:hypothetical protein